MKVPLALMLAFLAGCAGYDGRTLVPGQSSGAEVERVMGPAADKRPGPNGETVLWFPRLPAGRVSYAARIGRDDKLIAVEQRLTRQNLERLQPGVSRGSDVRDMLGPPERVDASARAEREVWTYHAEDIQPALIIVQFSADGVLREKYMFDDPDTIGRTGMN